MRPTLRLMIVSLLAAVLSPAWAMSVTFINPGRASETFWNTSARAAEAAAHALGVDFELIYLERQHLAALDVVREVHRVTRSGGRFCAVDSDDGLVIFHPQEPRVSDLLRDAQTVQAAQGGDRFIGRKLQGMMTEAGFINVRSRVLALTSSELPFQVLFNILLGYKASLLGGAVDARALYEELADKVAAGRRRVAAGVFIGSGEKA